MYYTSSGGGKPSGYSGQDGSHEYYSGGGTGYPIDSSSRPMSGPGMSYPPADMDYGQPSQMSYAGGSGAASWVDSSLASAQRSLQSWKSVGLSGAGAGAAPLGMERPGMEKPPAVDPSLSRMSSPWMSGPGGDGPQQSQAGSGGGRGTNQYRPPRAAQPGVQSFQPKGGANLRGSGAPPGPRAGSGPPGPPRSSLTAWYRNTKHDGGAEFGQGQDPRFGGEMSAPPSRGPPGPRGSGPRAAGGVMRPPPQHPQGPQHQGPQHPHEGPRPRERPQSWHAPPPPPQPGTDTRPMSASKSPIPLMDIQRPTTGIRMRAPSSSTGGPTPLMELTPFQARLQDFSTKSCSDLGISVDRQQQEMKKKKQLCSLEGFSTKAAADTSSSQKVEVARGIDNNEDDDDDDDEDPDMTQCKLCNIKFEKEQVFFP